MESWQLADTGTSALSVGDNDDDNDVDDDDAVTELVGVDSDSTNV